MTADRFKLQQAWWLASELGRRHPRVWVERFMHSTGPVLVAAEAGEDAGARVFFDLQAGVRAYRGESESHWSWETVLHCPGAHDTLKRIEVTSGLGIPHRAPATTARSIVYRLIARLLAMHLDAPRPWVPVPVEVQPMVHGLVEPEDEPLLLEFETAHRDVHNHRDDAAKRFGDPRSVQVRPWLWAMTRDVETAFVLDTDGFVHTRQVGVRPLLTMYDELGRDIDRLAVRVLELAGATRG
ncbi:hypothetical protein [Agrococcus lahaulensis]|uniref:TY-Chap2 family putative peptide chaperone n=1 Tax=Agrococcus lahaulensis TaxID=341722 RepID=UPI00047AF642|nr:hypothetical protein [Agrococcus lahaulensis]